MNWIKVIDRVPEVPYLIFALFMFIHQSDWDQVVHIFSNGFIFLAISFTIGAILKVTFKTKRARRSTSISVFKYGFPSMHTMLSVGGIAFFYFVDPLYAVVLGPIGVLYPYSRLKMKVHNGTDITGGAILGVIVGWITGMFILPLILPSLLELIFATFMFLVPMASTVMRIRLARAVSG
jgi:membrane-associated phospholipid phosphatase